MQCPHCDKRNTIKHGLSGSSQRYFCKECSHTFSIGGSTNKHCLADKLRFVSLLKELPFIDVLSMAGVARSTLYLWQKKYSAPKLSSKRFAKCAGNKTKPFSQERSSFITSEYSLI